MLRYPQFSRPSGPRQKTDHEQKPCSRAEQMQRIPPDKKCGQPATPCGLRTPSCQCPLKTKLHDENESDKLTKRR
jgi:hypothetical protein